MFRKTKNNLQLNVFSSNSTLLHGNALSVFEKESEWHNQFRTQVMAHIDEEPFRPLFCEDNGAPNASIRAMIGMMILKEAHGLSDTQLHDTCQYHIRFRSALGLHNFDDSLPGLSTYYLFRKRIVDWEKEHGVNLLEQVFAQVTKKQFIEFRIDGSKIRMDSKLLGSNIAWYSRYALIHETLRLAYNEFKNQIGKQLSESEAILLNEICSETGEKASYRYNKADTEARLTQLGTIIYKLISLFKGKPESFNEILRKVFYQQYEVIDDKVFPLPKEKIEATSIQSPHDPDCHYRKKGDKSCKGYNINVTETCDPENDVNLVTDIQLESASYADCDFLIPAIETTKEIVGDVIETLNDDGAYHKPLNETFCKENNIDHIISDIQGKPARYTYSFNENNELVATDRETGAVYVCSKAKTHNKDAPSKWKFVDGEGVCRYVTQKMIDTCELRKHIAERTKEELYLRNNVEATIFQLGYHYPNNKSRYRGRIKHKMWAFSRTLWINFVRIWNYIKSLKPVCRDSENSTKNDIYFGFSWVKKLKICLICLFAFIFCFKHSRDMFVFI